MNILAIQSLLKSQSLKPRTWEQTRLKWSGCTEGWTFVRNKLDTHCTLVGVKTKVPRSQNLSWKEEQQTGQGTSFPSGLQVVVTLLHKPSAVPQLGWKLLLAEESKCRREELLAPLFLQSPGSCRVSWSQVPAKGGTLSTHSVLKRIGERHFHGTAQHSWGWTSWSSSLKKYRAMHWGESPLGKEKYLESKLEDAYHE